MRKLITVMLFLACYWGLPAQFMNLSPQYKSKKGKKFSHYNDLANAQLKDGMYRWAAINSLHALEVSNKEKQTEKALILVTQAVPLAVKSSAQTLIRFESLADTAPQDEKVKHLQEISKIYAELSQIFKKSQDVSDIQGLSDLEVKDYSSDLETANQNLEAAKTKKAEQYYTDALMLTNHNAPYWKNKLASARALKMAASYQASHRDISDRLAAYRREGAVKVAVSNLYNKTRYSEEDWNPNSKIKNDWRNVKPAFEFVKLVDFHGQEKADVVMESRVTSLDYYTERGEPYKSSRAKIIDEKKEIVAKGTLITYSRTTFAKVTYTYEIFDVETENTLQTKTRTKNIIVDSDEWYKCSGDKRAFSETELTDNRESTAPNNRILYQEAMREVQSKISTALTSYIKPYAY